jgi:cytochrome c peroxidase
MIDLLKNQRRVFLGFPSRRLKFATSMVVVAFASLLFLTPSNQAQARSPEVQTAAGDVESQESWLNLQLQITLLLAGFSGKVESSLPSRLGRPVDLRLAEIGRKLFFDPITGLHDDNACAGCHAPNAGFGDTQSIAIGVQSNRIVGPDRKGPRNQRRTPSVLNTAFFPQLMWNSRFGAPSGSPFDNSQGYNFPAPEGTTRFPANDPIVTHLLIAQAHIPVTELNEAAGFTGTKGTISPRFDVFDDGLGSVVPMPDASGFRNDPIREAVVARLNATPAYRELFGTVFPEVRNGGPIDFPMYARSTAEFEFTLVRANAPIDQFARGDQKAMKTSEKRGALLFFGKANCVACHSVAGSANEMFSDFKNHNIAVPQIAPYFGVGQGNTIFDGPGEDEDFGMEQVTGNSQDRYKFRTSPLRNVALQRTFFHNGAYTTLEDAIRHHLDPHTSARTYTAAQAGVASDLQQRKGPVEPVLQGIDPLLANGIRLTEPEFRDLVHFVGNGLLDTRAASEDFCMQIPTSLPSNAPPLVFQGCEKWQTAKAKFQPRK